MLLVVIYILMNCGDPTTKIADKCVHIRVYSVIESNDFIIALISIKLFSIKFGKNSQWGGL